ncbi:MAG TPA: endonuclease [Candidatus Ozemobacteraceae bacterium]|nr:endonuclease [Candidatus Ozemobacteraceae bacterium]
MKKAGNGNNWFLALTAVALLFPWPTFCQDQTSTKINLSRQTVQTAQAGQIAQTPEPDSTDRTAEFKNILGIVDMIEEKYPASRDLAVKLRGCLYRHERNHLQQNFVPSRSVAVSIIRRPRPGVGDNNEALPGTDIYSSCEGLKDKALVAQLREISAYQVGVDYTQARKLMFTKIDNVGGEVECVYTGRKGRYTEIPSDRDMNCEHTWPQSLGATGVAKSDIFHLFPTDSKANSIRGSLPFGKVTNPTWEGGGSKCDGSVFEPRLQHRGNVARAKFYFAVRYGKSIDAREEAALREWNKEDPVDEAERERCNKIENVQHNRNPFIDHPEFADRISDF